MTFKKEIGKIYRLKVPFDDEVYTSVFFIQDEDGRILIDCGSSAWDVDRYILPALRQEGLSVSDIKYLVLTHAHCDHAGGKERIMQLNPQIKIVADARAILQNGYTMYALNGHTRDSVGVLDSHTHTLIAGDGLQGYGIGKYGCTFESREEYVKTIEKLQKQTDIENILFSHAYAPWNKDGAFGREDVQKCLQDCRDFIKGAKLNESDCHQ